MSEQLAGHPDCFAYPKDDRTSCAALTQTFCLTNPNCRFYKNAEDLAVQREISRVRLTELRKSRTSADSDRT